MGIPSRSAAGTGCCANAVLAVSVNAMAESLAQVTIETLLRHHPRGMPRVCGGFEDLVADVGIRARTGLAAGSILYRRSIGRRRSSPGVVTS